VNNVVKDELSVLSKRGYQRTLVEVYGYAGWWRAGWRARRTGCGRESGFLAGCRERSAAVALAGMMGCVTQEPVRRCLRLRCGASCGGCCLPGGRRRRLHQAR